MHAASDAGTSGAPRLLHGELPHGVRILPLTTHTHERGSLTELFRASWDTGLVPVQWNHVASPAGVMRGMHIHLGSTEYYVLLSGRTTLGYRDTRPGSPSEGAVALLELDGRSLHAVVGPPGIAHGIYCRSPSVLLVGVTAEWDPARELGCHWRDPALAIPWPFDDARLSEADAALPPLAAVASRVPPWSPA